MSKKKAKKLKKNKYYDPDNTVEVLFSQEDLDRLVKKINQTIARSWVPSPPGNMILGVPSSKWPK